MIKITHMEEVKRLQSLPQEVVVVVEEIATILDNEYGGDSDGGYVLIIESVEELDSLKDIYIDIDEVITEYIDLIEVMDGENYTNSLVLLNSDFAVSLIMPISLTPTRLLAEVQKGEN